MKAKKQKVALVFGNVPCAHEVDQFQVLQEKYAVTVVTSQSIAAYIKDVVRFPKLECLALPDFEENPTYIPGLEAVLSKFDVVIVKERLGLYAYQVVKSKWKNKFRLIVWVDNLAPLPAQDVQQMRVIREEVCNSADAFMVQSEAAKNLLVIEGVESTRIHYVTPHVTTLSKRTANSRQRALKLLGLPKDAFVLAHQGQIEWEESLIDLAAAVKSLQNKNPKIAEKLHVVVSGFGSLTQQFKEALLTLAIDNKFSLVAPHRDAEVTLLDCADGFFWVSTPSRDRIDGEPFRALLPMTHGIPLVSNRTVMIDEFLGTNYLQACASSPVSLAECLAKLSKSGAAAKLANKAKTSAKSRYSEKSTRAQMVSLLDKTANDKRTVSKESITTQIAAAEALVSSKQYLKAIDTIEALFKLDRVPTHVNANLYRLIGDCFAKLNDLDSARNAYNKSLEVDAYGYKALIGLGTVALLKQSHDIAVFNFQKAVNIAPQDEMANFGLGLAFDGMDERIEATNWILKSLTLNPYNTAALFTLVKISHQRQSYSDAERCLTNYLKRHSNDYNIAYSLAAIKFKTNKFDDAIELLKPIVKNDPGDTRAQALIAQCERAQEGIAASSL